MLTLLPPLEDTPPSITTNLSNTTIAENQTLTLTIGAGGSDLNYVWYKNDQVINGASSATLTILNVDASYDNNTFKVVISNKLGTVTSNTITLTVTDFLGVKVVKTETPVIIDGIEDPIWSNSNSYQLKNKILTIDNDADLSAKVNVLYDNQSLYVLYTVTDNQKRASSTNFWENDGIELYIDGNNNKASSYDANDFQFVIRYDASQIQEGHDKSVTGIVAKATQSTTGYVVEASVPWTLIGVTPSDKKMIGLDFHVNDSDLALRDGKITWFATQDNSYSDPSTFGLGRLESLVVTSVIGADKNNVALFPNPAKNTIRISGVSDKFAYSIMDYSGKEILSGTSDINVNIENLSPGFYAIWIQEDSKRTVMKFIKE
ncbi:MAG: T9SS type A sorting domain-containing protein [Sporocytophaga sp.]|nr:T9SS type A sorting domain-containing protein [Sporocytophaga sp.]